MNQVLSSGGPDAWSVGRMASAARRLIEEGVGQVWIKGEVSGLKSYQSGHWYFTLKDPDAQLRCVMWRSYAAKVAAQPGDGTEVYVLATPTVWEERGEFRLNVVVMLPTAGVGLAQQLYERTRSALEKDGLLDPARKRTLPAMPAVIALVTSPDGAVLRDMITVARRRWPSVRLLVVGTKVQGAEAEAELVQALGIVNRLEQVDLCIVGRGGGSREDLMVFNSEPVCRALAAVRVPTISAVGHETDVSLTDLVADVRAATPSAAMELALPDRAELNARVAVLARRMAAGLSRRTRLLAERLARTGDRLQVGVSRRIDGPRHRLERIAAQLSALDPDRVVQRGYAIARTTDGRVVRRRGELPAGTPFTLHLSDGDLAARSEMEPG
ncbi:MAG: exodeoxyribonuclease VII large subunit [Gemmatimonadota bacterium]|nr:exodeoxyribonuclease VII large subunit [Gemmatimonadota bacterium]